MNCCYLLIVNESERMHHPSHPSDWLSDTVSGIYCN